MIDGVVMVGVMVDDMEEDFLVCYVVVVVIGEMEVQLFIVMFQWQFGDIVGELGG